MSTDTSRLKLVVLGARPRTLPAAIVPVLVGTATAWWWLGFHHVDWSKAAGALVVSLAIQVGTNYANDYSDGVRGTDAVQVRAGPQRLTASGVVTPRHVAAAAVVSFLVAASAGLLLAASTSWWLLVVGAACIAAGWLYTGGPRPYGYLGLGELFVLVFFGFVATCGTSYVEGVGLSTTGFHVALVAAVTTGMLAVALLEANNLRDISGDRISGKRTLAVRLGRRRAGFLYVSTLAVALVAAVVLGVSWRPGALLALLVAGISIRPVALAVSEQEGRGLLPLLAGTAAIQLYAGVLLAVGILV